MKQYIISALLTFAFLTVTTGCDSKKSEPTYGSFIQHFEIEIDNKVIIMKPDNIEEVQVACNMVQSQGALLLNALNKKENLSFGILCKTEKLAIGTYEVYECLTYTSCDDKNQNATLMPYPTAVPSQYNDIKHAFKSPELGLTPLMLTISSIEDATWPGVPGVVKRIKGTFNGSLASVEYNPTSKIIGPLKVLKGKFDIYCQVL